MAMPKENQLRSAPCMSVAVSVKETMAVTFVLLKYYNPAMLYACVVVVLVRTSHSSQTVFFVQVSCLSPWSLKLCYQYSLATCTLQTAHLPILPLTAIFCVTAKEQLELH